MDHRQRLAVAACGLCVLVSACGKGADAPPPTASSPSPAAAAPPEPATVNTASSNASSNAGPVGQDFGDLKRRVARWFEGELSAGAGAVCSDQEKLIDPAGRVAFRNGIGSTPRGEVSALENTSSLEAQSFGGDGKLAGTLRVTDVAVGRRFSVLLTRASGWSTGSMDNLNGSMIHACVRDGGGRASEPPITATAVELLDGLSGSVDCTIVSMKDSKLTQRRRNYRFTGSKLVIEDMSADFATATTAILMVDNPTPDGGRVSMTYSAELPGERMVQVSRVNGRAVDSLKLLWPRNELSYECSPVE